MHRSYFLGSFVGAGITLISATAFAASSLPSNIKTEHTELGTVYATSKGMTVYEFKKDPDYTFFSASLSKAYGIGGV
ncbi:COG4315 family predicted lipoprotein [Acidiphilium iwatense]|uniref:Beta-lactamase n=1 Tax=Acidiphilium iwatense TaxID=768198 RepID=A0ABS9E220_9PROT|nr:hypothetical protein [Acidiphilium iwatense]MCF3948455.1 hypothetical protein [Acidiphilium iwatense]